MRPLAPTILAATLLPLLMGPPEREPATPGAPPAEGQDQEPERPRRTGPMPGGPAFDPRLEAIQGAWELTSIEDPVLAEDPAIRHSAMMLIVDGYLSLELHIGLVETTAEQLLRAYFQSGVHRVEVDSLGQLVLDSVLGAELDRDGYFDFEQPGRRRLYGFEHDGDGLILSRLDRRGRFIFRRVEHRPTRRDIFGRDVEPGPSDDDGR